MLYGARPALGLVALVTAITLPVGLLVGILSGYYGGWLERILMRFTDVVMSMPRLILAFAFVAMLGPGLVNGALALALTTGRPTPVRRAAKFSACAIATTSPRRRCWAFAAGGCWSAIFCRCVCRRRLSGWRSIWRALSSPPPGSAFSALGARPPMAEWGAMIADGMQVIFDQWWIAAIPGAAILLASPAFNLLGDGLRDILEPQHD